MLDNRATMYVISGVTGMTGSELVRQLITTEEKSYILGFDNFFASSIETVKDFYTNERFEFYEFDLNCVSQMEIIKKRVFELKSFYKELVYINCAAVVHTEYFYNINQTLETNVIGMRSFLEQAIEVEAQKFINCSTSEVYSMNSWNEKGGVKENDYILLSHVEHSQRTSYATGKLLTEFLMRDAVLNGKIKGCSIRFANVYSKNERFAKHIIPYIINSLKENGTVVLLENSKINRRTFLYNYDSCSAVLALIRATDALDGSAYNVSTDEEVTIVQLVKMIADKMKIEKPIIYFSGYRESDPERRLLSTEKLRMRTKWKPNYNLSKGLDECLEYYLKKR